jgi:hypothetical protein
LSFGQKVDTGKIIRAIEKELKRQGLPNAKFELSVKSYNQTGGQTAFEISNYYGAHSHIVNGTNNGINGDVNFISERYSLMAKLNIMAKEYETPFNSVNIIFSSPLINLMAKIITRPEPNTYQICNDTGCIKYIDSAIAAEPYFPFSYWAKAAFLSSRSDERWVFYAEKAREILKHTTNIAGHNEIHDVVLVRLNEDLNKYYSSKAKH